jgi:hypothetical protein
VPKVTSPRAFPTGLATELVLHPLGPTFFSVAAEQLPKPLELIFTPAGEKTLTCEIGGIPPAGFWVVTP